MLFECLFVFVSTYRIFFYLISKSGNSKGPFTILSSRGTEKKITNFHHFDASFKKRCTFQILYSCIYVFDVRGNTRLLSIIQPFLTQHHFSLALFFLFFSQLRMASVDRNICGHKVSVVSQQ